MPIWPAPFTFRDGHRFGTRLEQSRSALTTKKLTLVIVVISLIFRFPSHSTRMCDRDFHFSNNDALSGTTAILAMSTLNAPVAVTWNGNCKKCQTFFTSKFDLQTLNGYMVWNRSWRDLSWMNISLKGTANINISLTSHELFEARPNIRLMTIIAVGDFIISSTHLQLEIRQEDKRGEWKNTLQIIIKQKSQMQMTPTPVTSWLEPRTRLGFNYIETKREKREKGAVWWSLTSCVAAYVSFSSVCRPRIYLDRKRNKSPRAHNVMMMMMMMVMMMMMTTTPPPP